MANDSPRICVVGSTNVDLTFRTPRLPRPGETLTGRDFRLGSGGKGANQAVTAARLGARVAMVSRVGCDVFGESALRTLREEGVDTTFVVRDDVHPTGVAGIVVDDAAQNCILVVPGANAGLTPADVRAAAPVIRAASVVLCQLEIPLESTLEALRLARAAGVLTVLNPAPAVSLPEELLRLADLCVPNETEAETLSGRSAATPEDACEAAEILRGHGAAEVVVTLGERGAVLVGGAGVEHFPAVPVEAVDASGAGDAFIGSLAVSRARGRSPADAVRRAGVVAALSVTRAGTQASFPRRAEAEKFLARHGLAGGV